MSTLTDTDRETIRKFRPIKTSILARFIGYAPGFQRGLYTPTGKGNPDAATWLALSCGPGRWLTDKTFVALNAQPGDTLFLPPYFTARRMPPGPYLRLARDGAVYAMFKEDVVAGRQGNGKAVKIYLPLWATTQLSIQQYVYCPACRHIGPGVAQGCVECRHTETLWVQRAVGDGDIVTTHPLDAWS